MENLINLFEPIIYNKVRFTLWGLSGGCDWYEKGDFIPDCIIYLHRLSLN